MATVDFTAAGAAQYTKPAGVTELTIELAAAAGSGRGSGTAATPGVTASGGSGAVVRSVLSGLPEAETVYNLQVGSGGAGSTGVGADGTASWFDSTTTVYADFGKGATGGVPGTPGAGGAAVNCIGDEIIAGEDGDTDGLGHGGDCPSIGSLTGGLGGEPPASDGPGNPGAQPGGGGSGCRDTGALAAQAGGDGADGWVRVIETIAAEVTPTWSWWVVPGDRD